MSDQEYNGSEIREWLHERSTPLLIATLLILLVLVFFWPYIFISIYPGQRGVLWSRFFGTVTDRPPYQEGLVFVLPWNRVYIYDVRFKHAVRNVKVLSSDGLEIQVEISVRYEPVEEHLGRLHQQVGPDFLNIVVIPEVEAAVREVIGKYRPEELYTVRRSQIQDEITDLSQREITDRFVHVDEVLVREIVLPLRVRTAIENKLAEEQKMLQYDFVLQREEKEAERKAIEARGIQNFQSIVNQGITPAYLRWKGIDATLKLAGSTNAKIVIIGAGPDGLPVILNFPDQEGLGPTSGATSSNPPQPQNQPPSQ